MAVQDKHNEIAVDNAFNTLQQKNLSRLFGDPNNPNQKGYFSLRGADAMNAHELLPSMGWSKIGRRSRTR